MPPSSATTTAPPPCLLTLPSSLLAIILESLPPADLIRTLNLISKHSVLVRFAHSQGSEEGTLWTRMLREYLSRFSLARAWFGLREDDTLLITPMRDRYNAAASTVDRRLAAVQAASGLTGTEWTWEEEGVSDVNKRKLLFVPTSVPSGKQQGDFLAWLGAFPCNEC